MTKYILVLSSTFYQLGRLCSFVCLLKSRSNFSWMRETSHWRYRKSEELLLIIQFQYSSPTKRKWKGSKQMGILLGRSEEREEKKSELVNLQSYSNFKCKDSIIFWSSHFFKISWYYNLKVTNIVLGTHLLVIQWASWLS